MDFTVGPRLLVFSQYTLSAYCLHFHEFLFSEKTAMQEVGRTRPQTSEATRTTNPERRTAC